MMPNTEVLHDLSNGDAEWDAYLVRLAGGITAMRERRLMSRKALASRLRVRTTVLGAWERGEHLPPGDKLLVLMLVLEVSPAELLVAGERASTRLRAKEAGG
jgi:ribosome-binding protein aMBF1 (putative translation factor)